MEMKTVRLVRRHTHAGRVYEPGAQLSIAKRQAEWLISQGVATGQAAAIPAELAAPGGAAETRPAQVTKVPMRTGGCCGGRW